MTPCREFPTRNRAGYGCKWDREQKKMVRMHRWVVAQVHGWGAIEGKVVMHLCDNKACYRYDHLSIGTQADNIADMAAKGRHRRQNEVVTHCKRGHEFTEENTYINPGSGKRKCRACQASRRAKQ